MSASLSAALLCSTCYLRQVFTKTVASNHSVERDRPQAARGFPSRLRPWRPSRQTLDIMSNAVPAEISVQLSLALNAIERHLESTLLAVHL